MRAIPLSLLRPPLSLLPPAFSYNGGAAASGGRTLNLDPTEPTSNPKITADLLPLISNFYENPNNPKILSSVDSILSQSHLLDSTTSLLLLRALARSRKLTRAKTLLSSLNRRAKVPNFFLYSTVLQCLLPQNPIRDVECVWNEISGEPSGVTTESFVLLACRRCEDALDVEPLCHRLLSWRWPLGYRAFAALIGALCLKKNPNPGLAREVLREMMERGFQVDNLSYYTVFRSFCRNGDLFGADSVLRGMVEGRKCALDLLIYGDFLHGLCKAGKFREARKLFDKMSKRVERHGSILNAHLIPGRRAIFQLCSSNVISETMAIEVYFQSLCCNGRLEEAKNLLKEAMRKNLVPEFCVDNSFVNALFSAGRHEEALMFFETKKKGRHGSAGDIAIAVISGLCKIGRVDDSYELLCEVVNEGYILTVCAWNLILESYLEDEKVEKAMEIFERIKSGNLSAYLRPDGSTYAIVIHGLLRKGMVEQAIRVLEEMESRKFPATVDLYIDLVRSLHLYGRPKEAQETRGVDTARRRQPPRTTCRSQPTGAEHKDHRSRQMTELRQEQLKTMANSTQQKLNSKAEVVD